MPGRRDRNPKGHVGICLFAGAIVFLLPAPSRAQNNAASPAPAAAQPSPPVPLESVKPGPSSPVSTAAKPETLALPDLTLVGWSVPPIRWGGTTSSSYSWNNSSGAGNSFNETQALNLRASSYIYQPWYAQVSGDFGVLGTKSSTTDTAGTDSRARSTAFTYGGNLSLFPQSRFPFQAFMQANDSRANANSSGTQYTSTRLGARQSYRPEVGPENYTASADRSIVATAGARSVVDALQGMFSTNLDDHTLSANARYARNSGDIAGQGSQLIGFNGTHGWRLDEEINVASSVGYSNNQIRMLTGTGLAFNNSQVLQAGSSVTWIPDEDLPLTVTGGGNFLHMNTATDIAQSTIGSINGYATANYRFSENMSGTAGANVARTQSNGVGQLLTSQSASVSYVGNTLTFDKYSYHWGSGAGITNQLASNGPANRSLSAQAQHSLSRSLDIGGSGALVLNASQAYALGTTSSAGNNGTLSHMAGALWRLDVSDMTQGMVSANVSDSLTSGSVGSHHRQFSTLGNIQTQLSSRAALAANVNFVVSQQLAAKQSAATAATPADTVAADGNRTMSGAGQISYNHRSPFDISNLFYTASLQINASQTNLRLVSGNPDASAWQMGNVLTQNANYRYGRLVFNLTNSFATLNGKKNASLFLTISREIGDL